MIACRNQSPEEYINTVAVKLCAINSMNGFQERGGILRSNPQQIVPELRVDIEEYSV